jgi:hypothetical protein
MSTLNLQKESFETYKKKGRMKMFKLDVARLKEEERSRVAGGKVEAPKYVVFWYITSAFFTWYVCYLHGNTMFLKYFLDLSFSLYAQYSLRSHNKASLVQIKPEVKQVVVSKKGCLEYGYISTST